MKQTHNDYVFQFTLDPFYIGDRSLLRQQVFWQEVIGAIAAFATYMSDPHMSARTDVAVLLNSENQTFTYSLRHVS